jgi:lipoyl(octanoyl) transferase
METKTSKQIRIDFRDLGTIDYREAWDYQEALFDKISKFKISQTQKLSLATEDSGETLNEGVQNSNLKGHPGNFLLFCEHPPVFTLGKSGSGQNLLINEEMLKQKGISFYRINRGGDITFHGPGQIVGYPILDLELFGLGVKSYIYLLEEAIILTLKEYGMESSRLKGATGVWLDADVPGKARKIAAIGVRASRYVTMHGFAFNVNTDLSYYRYINPCGFTDKGVTSMEIELGRKMDFEEVKEKLRTILINLLQQLNLC